VKLIKINSFHIFAKGRDYI